MGSLLLLLLIAALAGPMLLGVLASRSGWRTARLFLFLTGAALPVLLSTILWFCERMAAHGGDLFGTQTDGDLGIILAQFVSILLLPVSAGLTFLGQRLGSRSRSSAE